MNFTKRAIAFLLCVLTLLTSFPAFSLGISAETKTVVNQNDIGASTKDDVPVVPQCSCENHPSAPITEHAVDCARKTFLRLAARDDSARVLYSMWDQLTADEQDYVLGLIVDSEDIERYNTLKDLIAQGSDIPVDSHDLVIGQSLTLNAAVDASSYCWQVFIAKIGTWVNIYGQNGVGIELNHAMLDSASDGNSVEVRCLADGVRCYQSEITFVEQEIGLVEETLPLKSGSKKSPAKLLGEGASGEETQVCKFTIKYVYASDTKVDIAQAYETIAEKGKSFTLDKYSPEIKGYAPANSDLHIIREYDSVTEDEVTIIVKYYPIEVKFYVDHYWQSIEDLEQYFIHETIEKTGYTDTKVGTGLMKSYTGFEAHGYDPNTVVAADGSTHVRIDYDRKYFLILFDLRGGYGVEPIYAPYGTEINWTAIKGSLKFAGHDFKCWDVEDKDLPATVEEDRLFTVTWTAYELVNVSVVYWYENADDSNYSYAGSKSHSAAPESTITSAMLSNFAQGESSATGDSWHFNYNKTKSEADNLGKTVAFDGSTVVNLYFTRKSYSIYFYEKNKDNNAAICGNTSFLHIHSDSCRPWKQVASYTAKWHANINPYWAETGAGGKDPGNRWNPYACSSISGEDNGAGGVIYGGGLHVGVMTVMLDGHTYISADDKYFPGAKGQWVDGIHFRFDGNGDVKCTGYYMCEPVSGSANIADFQQRYKCVIWMGGFTENEEYIDIPGFTKVFSWSEIQSKYIEHLNLVVYKADTAHFYYWRNSYNVEFYNVNAVTKTVSAKYEKTLGTIANNIRAYTPPVPDGYDPNAWVFDDWYYDENCTAQVDWDNGTVPDHNLRLYAKWIPATYQVTIRDDYNDPIPTPGTAGKTFTALANNTINETAPANPTREGYTFVAWFYMKDGQEKPYDFRMPVMKSMDLYPHWIKLGDGTGTIRYMLRSTGEEIADPTEIGGMLDTSITYYAKSGASLYKDFQEGCFPETSSHNVSFTKTSGNDYVFYYKLVPEIEYTVKYISLVDGSEIATAKTAKSRSAAVLEKFAFVKGYCADAYDKIFVISADNPSENVFSFFYTKDDVHAPLHIVHLVQDVDGEYTEIAKETKRVDAVIGQTYSDTFLNLGAGFTANAAKSNTSGTLTEDGLELVFYYDRNVFPYEFKFVEKGTGKVLAESVTGEAPYQKTITQAALSIPGYERETVSSLILNVDVVTGTGDTTNVRAFYYSELDATIKYAIVGEAGCGSLTSTTETVKAATGSAAGSKVTTNLGYEFVGWYADATCQNLVTENATIVPSKGSDGAYHDMTYYAKVNIKYADYTKNIYKEDLNGNYPCTESYPGTAQVGKTVSMEGTAIEGFTFDAGKSSLSGTVVEDNSLEIFARYNRNSYDYTFKFLEQGTDKVLATAVTGTAKFEATVSQSALTIKGYTLLSDASQSIQIGTKAEENVKIFYYSENNALISYVVKGSTGGGTVNRASETLLVVTGEAQGSTATANVGYGFDGWYSDAECKNLISTDATFVPTKTDGIYVAATYYAKFSPRYGNYRIEFYFEGVRNDSLTQTGREQVASEVGITSIPDFTGYTYDDENSNPTGTIIETAVDAEGIVLKLYYTLDRFTVTWKNYDGTVLETDENVGYGSTPSYDGTTPAREKTAQYTYTFTGWSPALSEVTDNVVYVAQFEATTNAYTVTWKNYDGTVLEKDENVLYGTMPTYDGSTPTKPATAVNTFTFNGWLPAVAAVTQDVVYTATFKGDSIEYKITYVVDGVTDREVGYSTDDPVVKYTPTKQYFDFHGWYSDANCTVSAAEPDKMPSENITLYGKFTHSLVKLTVSKSGMKAGEFAIFTVKGSGIEGGVTIVVSGNGGSVTISNIHAGCTYTITEDTGWSWNYTPDEAQKECFTAESVNTVEFTNESDNAPWLDSTARKTNEYGGGTK